MPPKASPQAPPRSDAYTGMLVISLLALLAGCVFMYLDYSEYGSTKPDKPAPTFSKAQPGGVQGGAGAAGNQGGGAAGMQGGAAGMQGGAAGMQGGAAGMQGGMQ